MAASAYDTLIALAPQLMAAPERLDPAATGMTAIGTSRAGRPLQACRLGHGPLQLSLIAGCHADEPVGPRLLSVFTGLLQRLPADHPVLRLATWWIVPHANPDGAAVNAPWQTPGADEYDLDLYLRHAVRERPGEDLEFGFPRDPSDTDARPEAQAIAAWWRSAGAPFHFHASLHGMSYAPGPWYLLEAAWADRMEPMRRRCVASCEALGYRLNPVDRGGEKGFTRLAEGFSTRPDSRAMQAHFHGIGDATTAALFRPSSMETIRSLGGDPLTIVSEMPLFLTAPTTDIRDPAFRAAPATDDGLRPMPVAHQFQLIWHFLAAAIDLIEATGE